LVRKVAVRYHFLLFLFFAPSSFAATDCNFFIGDGSILKPEVSKLFIDDLKLMHGRWKKECDVIYNLINWGKESSVYDGEKYTKLKGVDVHKPASKKRIKLFIGDHGAPKGLLLGSKK